MNIRHEEYSYSQVPFCFNTNLIRTKNSVFPDMNWHNDIEIQLCNGGEGIVFADGEKYLLDEKRAIVLNSNSIHYTVTDSHLNYSALIISAEFCKKMGFDCEVMEFETIVEDKCVLTWLKKLQELYDDKEVLYLTAKENILILQILTALSENHSRQCSRIRSKGKSFAYVKAAIAFIRNNYNSKILIDDIAGEICVDKYFLCRVFKEKTGKTIVEYINTYRCNQAMNLILEGCSVSEAASACGFDNFSYFTKLFKRIVGKLPSKLNR